MAIGQAVNPLVSVSTQFTVAQKTIQYKGIIWATILLVRDIHIVGFGRGTHCKGVCSLFHAAAGPKQRICSLWRINLKLSPEFHSMSRQMYRPMPCKADVKCQPTYQSMYLTMSCCTTQSASKIQPNPEPD